MADVPERAGELGDHASTETEAMECLVAYLTAQTDEPLPSRVELRNRGSVWAYPSASTVPHGRCRAERVILKLWTGLENDHQAGDLELTDSSLACGSG